MTTSNEKFKMYFFDEKNFLSDPEIAEKLTRYDVVVEKGSEEEYRQAQEVLAKIRLIDSVEENDGKSTFYFYTTSKEILSGVCLFFLSVGIVVELLPRATITKNYGVHVAMVRASMPLDVFN